MARDIEIKYGDRQLERGGILKDDIIRARIYGPSNGPAVIVLGGISATRHVCDGGKHGRGWWSPMVRIGGPIDTSRLKVIGCDFAPNNDSDHIPVSYTHLTLPTTPYV